MPGTDWNPTAAEAVADSAAGGSRRGLGLRGRLVLLTTIGLAVGLIVGGVVLTVVLRLGLVRAADEAIEQTAQEVAQLIDVGRLPDPVPAGGTTVVQVLDDAGRVLAASPGADRLVAALPADQLALAREGPITLSGSLFGVLGSVRVVAMDAGSAGSPSTVLVATPSSDIDDSVAVVRLSLVIGFAVLLVVLAIVAWRLIGATLRPVEALRVGAERITGTNSAETLPLPNSADEIRRLAETLNDMLGRLEASRLRQRAFVADAAHELRSPLASLRTQLDVAVATGDAADTADLLAEVERLTRLVNDLLLLARVDDAAPPPLQLLDIAAFTTEVANRYAAQPIPVAVDGVPVPPVSADPRAVDRVLANVLDNAVRYARSAVRVSVGPSGGGVLVVVSDDGPGIPEDDRERVFERFARLHDARDRDSGGTGPGVGDRLRAHRRAGRPGGAARLGEWRPAGGAVVPGGRTAGRIGRLTTRPPRDNSVGRMPPEMKADCPRSHGLGNACCQRPMAAGRRSRLSPGGDRPVFAGPPQKDVHGFANPLPKTVDRRGVSDQPGLDIRVLQSRPVAIPQDLSEPDPQLTQFVVRGQPLDLGDIEDLLVVEPNKVRLLGESCGQS